jgi:hypothetical protein
MPRLPPVMTATLLENSPDTIESSVIAEFFETGFDVIKERRLISQLACQPFCFSSPWFFAKGRRETKNTDRDKR